MNEILIAQELIKKKSVTPENDGAIEYLADLLKKIGFECKVLIFEEKNYEKIVNLYAKYGNSDKNLAFAGHTDVVPTGDLTLWKHNPFASHIENGILYGRGAVDMKSAIAAFFVATKEFLEKNKHSFKDSISFIITGDEESDSVNGTKKIVKYLQEQNENISHTIVGEPTNPNKLGEMIKVGRRGSINFTLTAIGKQGHVAYPHNALNPNASLVRLLNLLIDYKFDNGNEFF